MVEALGERLAGNREETANVQGFHGTNDAVGIGVVAVASIVRKGDVNDARGICEYTQPVDDG